MKNNDVECMAKAIQLAEKPVFSPHPNPRVGCVIVKDNVVIGEGYHEFAGGPHAEVNALAQAGEAAKNAVAYVTLEPCSHFGRTPPCADALIKAQVSKVVVAMQDPNPQVAGEGVKKLQAAGIQVEVGVLESHARNLNKGFIKRMLTGMPWVCSKIAMSLDGRTAMASGESKWITGSAARQDVQLLRAKTHAILSGSGTVMADNPRFTVRDIEARPESVRQPIRVIVDSAGKIDKASSIFNEDGQTILALVNTPTYECDFIQTSVIDGKVNLKALLKALADKQINEVLVEAGPGLNGALLSQGLIDEVIVYMAPDVMGDGANGMFHLPELKKMKDKITFECEDVRKIGRDIRMTLTPLITNAPNEEREQ